ncbi:Hypothetical predicted protein [Pelobates cultripes]|uniref:Uncharacterized protein n=1 Tax=Pelobates cultripes TaxID=61616 RepID=A0AAD1WDG5_PELCU|nr:Hypothetical predicted protein [Pelobates cultripes]
MEGFDRLCKGLWTLLRHRGVSGNQAARTIASWIRPVTRRRHYRYPLQANRPSKWPRRRQNPSWRTIVPGCRNPRTRTHAHSGWINEPPLQPHHLLTTLRPEKMAEHHVAVQKDASHRNTTDGTKPGGPTGQRALYGHSKYLPPMPVTGIG